MFFFQAEKSGNITHFKPSPVSINYDVSDNYWFGGKDACAGDSGSPLWTNIRGHAVLVGLGTYIHKYNIVKTKVLDTEVNRSFDPARLSRHGIAPIQLETNLKIVIKFFYPQTYG